jgi:predicted nucleotidyltransferase
MVTIQRIRELVVTLSARFAPEKVILFGSYANGVPTADSDVDLLVILPGSGGSRQSLRKQLEIVQAIDAPFPMDLMVRRAGEVAKRIAMNDFFIRDIVSNGKTLYEADHARVGGEGRSGFSDCTTRTSRPKKSQPRRRVLSRVAVR